MTAHITAYPAIGSIKAARLGEFLGKYAISTGNLSVWQCQNNRGCEKENALTQTVAQVSSAVASSIPASMAAAPAAAPIIGALTLFFGAWLLPLLLALLAGEVGLIHATNKRMPKIMSSKGDDGRRHPDYSEIRFELTNVSAKRRAWTEYLIFIWCANEGMKFHGAQHPDREEAAARAIAKHGRGYYPPPWSDGGRKPKANRKPRKAARKAKRKTRRAKRSLSRSLRGLW